MFRENLCVSMCQHVFLETTIIIKIHRKMTRFFVSLICILVKIELRNDFRIIRLDLEQNFFDTIHNQKI